MLRSMTGYGESDISRDRYTVSCEARSLNARFLNISIKLPESLQYLESEIREAIRSKLTRGSVNIIIKMEEAAPESYKVDRHVLDHWMSILKEIRKKMGTTRQPDPGIFFSLPGVVEKLEPPSDVRIREATLLAVDKALNLLVKMRTEEGKNLSKDLRRRLDKIRRYVDKIEKRSVKSTEERKKALKRRIEEFLTDYDKQRLNFEILTQIDKFEIKEELVRLRSHLTHFKKVFDEPPPVGSKLIYLSQEMHREANTLSVKSMDGPISLSIVLIKEELERIREQLQNVE